MDWVVVHGLYFSLSYFSFAYRLSFSSIKFTFKSRLVRVQDLWGSVKLYHVSRSCGLSDLRHIPDHTKLVSLSTCFIHVPIPVSCTSDLTSVSCIGPYL